MNPDKYAETKTEHAQQVALFMWMSQNYHIWPELEWAFAIPNGGERQAAVAARLKAEGVKSGVSDIFFPFPRGQYTGFFLEMKNIDSGKESKEQKDFGFFVTGQGFHYKCCHGFHEARIAVLEYLSL